MALTWSSDVFSGLGGAVQGIFGGVAANKTASGYAASAAGYAKASQIAAQNEQISRVGTSIKQLQASREIFRALGGQQADIAGAGLKATGSALDVIRASAAEGALTRQLIGLQGSIEALGYRQEAESYASMAQSAAASGSASKSSGLGSTIGGLISGAAGLVSLFSDERMKEDIALVRRLDNGIGIYRFRYKGSPVVFEGVLAQEVEQIRPSAVEQDEHGNYKVNYDMIGVEPRVIDEGTNDA